MHSPVLMKVNFPSLGIVQTSVFVFTSLQYVCESNTIFEVLNFIFFRKQELPNGIIKKVVRYPFIFFGCPSHYLLHALHRHTGCPKKTVSRLYVCCGGAVDSIISIFTQLHRSSLNLEFETLYESF